MSRSKKEIFEKLLQKAKKDQNIIGLFLGGSRGKEFEHENSDYDIWFILKDNNLKLLKDLKKEKTPGVDTIVLPLTKFIDYAKWQSDTHWDRYNFTHVKAIIDKTNNIQKLINQKGTFPKDKKAEYINDQLEPYINSFYRSIKSFARKDEIGIRFEAANSLPHLLNALFALHNRTAPFASYLTRELKHYPLEKLPLTIKKLEQTLLEILNTGNLKTQQELFKKVKDLFKKENYSKAFDNWEETLAWIFNNKK